MLYQGADLTDKQNITLYSAEFYDSNGKFLWKDIENVMIPEMIINPAKYNGIILWLHQDAEIGKLKIYNERGVVLGALEGVCDFQFSESYSYISYKRIQNGKYLFGLAGFNGNVLWEKSYSEIDGDLILEALSDNGNLLVCNKDKTCSYSPVGEQKWMSPKLQGNIRINENGSRLLLGYSSTQLINNENGKQITSTKNTEFEGIKISNNYYHMFIKESNLFVVDFYDEDSKKEFFAIVDESGKCIAIYDITGKYPIESIWYFQFLKNEDGDVEVYFNQKLMEKIIID